MLGLTKHADVKVHGDVGQVASQLFEVLSKSSGNHKDGSAAQLAFMKAE